MRALAAVACLVATPAAADVLLSCTPERSAATDGAGPPAAFAVRIAAQPQAVREVACEDPAAFLCANVGKYLSAYVAPTAEAAAASTKPAFVTDDTGVVHGSADTLEPLSFNGSAAADVLAVFDVGDGTVGYWRLDVTVGAPGDAVIDSGSCTRL